MVVVSAWRALSKARVFILDAFTESSVTTRHIRFNRFITTTTTNHCELINPNTEHNTRQIDGTASSNSPLDYDGSRARKLQASRRNFDFIAADSFNQSVQERQDASAVPAGSQELASCDTQPVEGKSLNQAIKTPSRISSCKSE